MESALCDTDANLKAEAVTWVCSLFERTTHVWHQSTDVGRMWAKYNTYGHGGDLFVKVSCNNVVADISIGVALQYFGGKVVTQLIAEFEEGLDEILTRVSDEAEALLRVAAGPDAMLAARRTFLEKRMCTCNVCVIGRTPALSQQQRAAFEAADNAAGLRARVLAELLAKFGPKTQYALNFAIGGQIGIDCAPCGWDKTFCLPFLPEDVYPIIHFFGDKTHEGGGDYELYEHPRTIGHTVTSAEHTLELVERLLLS